MDYKDYVVQDPRFFRPTELKHLKGSNERLKKVIDLEFEYDFDSMINEMIEYWMEKL